MSLKREAAFVMIFSSALAFGIIGIAILLAGCPKPLPPPPRPPDQTTVTYCETAVEVRTADACQDVFTPDGHPCAVCHGGAGCVAPGVEVWCIIAGNCALAITDTHECGLVQTPASRR